MDVLVFGLAAAIASNPIDPLGRMSDEFDDPSTLSNWSRIHLVEGWNADQLQVLDIDTTQPSRLVMVPHTSTWYQDYRGELTFKEVTGDFVITAEIHASGLDGESVPAASFSLGGIMLRTPRAITNPAKDWAPGGENYVFGSIGHGSPTGPCSPGPGWHLELKTTTNSISDLCLSPWPSGTFTVQIARIADAIIMLVKLPEGNWELLNRYSRPDFPETLQVGMVSYTDYNKASTYTPFFHNGHVLAKGLRPDRTSNPRLPFAPDLEVGFEFARYHYVQVPDDLIGIDLVNEATLEQLLTFLGDWVNQEPFPSGFADLNNDGIVNGADLGLLLAAWGSDDAAADLDDDGTVNGSDLGLMLAVWSG